MRRARLSDDADLGAIREQAILVLAEAEMGREQAMKWAKAPSPDRIARAIEQHEVWVGELDGEVIGWVEIDRDRLRGMYVRPDLSGRGLGSALLAHAEKMIASDGHRAVYLSASWNAEPFYFRNGYQALADRPADTARPMVKHLS